MAKIFFYIGVFVVARIVLKIAIRIAVFLFFRNLLKGGLKGIGD